MDFVAGDRVQAVSPRDQQRYPGTVEGSSGDGTYTVRWDDPAGGPETDEIDARHVRKMAAATDFAVGDDVQALSAEDSNWYPGSVLAANADGTFTVLWDDLHSGQETADVRPEDMQKVDVFRDYEVEDAVEAVSPVDGELHIGTVEAKNQDGTFLVRWDDPAGGPEESIVSPKRMRFPRLPVLGLQVGEQFSGTVVKILWCGALVDIGAETAGFVHISCIRADPVVDVREVLEEGQEVDVWVSEIRNETSFELTMVEGRVSQAATQDVSPFADVPPEEWLDGVVLRFAPFGAFVTVTAPTGEKTDGLVHVRQIRDGFIENVEDELSIGEAVKVRVISVDLEGHKLGLSMKEPGKKGGRFVAPGSLEAFVSQPPNEFLPGKVTTIMPFGAFVTVTARDGTKADGLVHKSDIKESFVRNVQEVLQEGQEVEVRVLSVDLKKSRMSLSMKRPRTDVSRFADIPPDKWLNGVVLRFASFGAFVRVTAPTGEKTEGLLPLREIRDGFIKRLEDELSIGQAVKVRIVSVDLKGNKLDLSMMELGASRDRFEAPVGPSERRPRSPEGRGLEAFAEQPPDEFLAGTVASVKPFGAFVTVIARDGTEADGLVHKSEIQEGFVRDVQEVLWEGRQVSVRVLSVDLQQGRMSLSMKQPEE